MDKQSVGAATTSPKDRRIDRFVGVIETINEWIGRGASYLILLLALVVGYDVVMRYVFQRPTVWAQEFSTMLFGTFIILGGAYTARSGSTGHVNMDVLYHRFSKRGRAILDVITFFLLTVPFLGILMWKGGEAAWRSIITLEHDSTQWGPPLYPIRVMLPLGAFLFFVQMVTKLIRDILTITSPEEKE